MKFLDIKGRCLAAMLGVFLVATFFPKEGLADTSTNSESKFQQACEAKLKIPVGGAKPSKVCECIINNLAKKLKNGDLRQIESLYQGKDPSQLKLAEPTLDFEMEVSAKCLKNSSWRL